MGIFGRIKDTAIANNWPGHVPGLFLCGRMLLKDIRPGRFGDSK